MSEFFISHAIKHLCLKHASIF